MVLHDVITFKNNINTKTRKENGNSHRIGVATYNGHFYEDLGECKETLKNASI